MQAARGRGASVIEPVEGNRSLHLVGKAARSSARSTSPVAVNSQQPAGMPEISRFLGIVIAMYYRDHAPPHFHAFYGDYEVTVEIASGEVNGEFPRRALAHVQEWRTIHGQELLDTWTLARAGKPLPRVEPLE